MNIELMSTVLGILTALIGLNTYQTNKMSRAKKEGVQAAEIKGELEKLQIGLQTSIDQSVHFRSETKDLKAAVEEELACLKKEHYELRDRITRLETTLMHVTKEV